MSNEVSYIPNEIANAAVDEHGNRKPVTRSHNIYDDGKQQWQDDLNKAILEEKNYSAADFSGMGRVVLQKNIVDVSGVSHNLLTQAMMQKPNTIYVIQYDFEIDPAIINATAAVSTDNVSQAVNPAYANALAAYNQAHDAWIAADNAYTNNPNETTLAAKNTAYAAYQEAQEALDDNPQYYYYASTAIQVAKGRKIIIPSGCVLINSSLNGVVTIDIATEDTTVYIGSTTAGSYAYNVQYEIVVPAGCMIKFEGGSISNGTMRGNQTVLVYDRRLNDIFSNVVREGTFIYNNTLSADEEDLTEDGNILKFKDRGTEHGMGRIILRRDKSFASQVTQENTIYVIQYDFTLDDNVEIPTNCVLEFDGGSLRNGTIDMNDADIISANTFIFDNVQILNYRGVIDLHWFIPRGTTDITEIINSLNGISRIRFIDDGTYEISDSVTFEQIRYIDWNTNLRYTGIKTGLSLVKFVNCSAARITFDGTFYPSDGNTAVDTVNDNTDVVGVDVINCHDCEYYISGIGYFNEALRVSGLGAGCARNTFYIGITWNCNRHIRVYQNNVDNNLGWANENYFYNGNCALTTDWRYRGNKSTAIHIEGGSNDAYNKCNQLTFFNFCCQGFGTLTKNGISYPNNGYTIYAKNTAYTKFINIRNESGESKLVKFVNDGSTVCLYNEIRGTYPSTGADIDIIQSTCNPLRNVDFKYCASFFAKDVKLVSYSGNYQNVYSKYFVGNNGSHNFMRNATYPNAYIMLPINNQSQYFSLTQFIKGFFLIAFLDNNKDNITATLDSSGLSFQNFLYVSAQKAYRTPGTTLRSSVEICIPGKDQLPANATYVLFGISIINTSNGLIIESNIPMDFDPEEEISIGAYANRPVDTTKLYYGKEYYCTDLNKYIYWGGSDWVDALGNSVSTAYVPAISSGTVGNVPKIKADGTLEDSGKAATNIPSE